MSNTDIPRDLPTSRMLRLATPDNPLPKSWFDNYLDKWNSDKYNLLTTGINAGTSLLGSLINRNLLSSTPGNILTGIGKVAGNLPGPLGWLGQGLGLIGLGINAVIGHKFNDSNIASIQKDINDRNNYLFGDYSNTSSLISGSLANRQLGHVSKDFIGHDGWFSNKVANKTNDINTNIDLANLRANNNELLAYANYLNNLVRNAISNDAMGNVNMTANGGPLNMISGPMTPFGNRFFANGGYTHGGLFTNGFIEVNNGGSHELNPNLGVLYGVDDMGVPNLVEEGETIFNAGSYGGPDNYAFSNRLNFPVKEYGEMFSLGGITKHKKGKRAKNYTFADVSKLLAKESEERPNDSKSLRTFAENLSKLALIQEEVKARDAISLMNPLDIMAALQQSPMGNQMVGDAQYNADEQAMMELLLEPMMAACGGKLHSLGGKLFRYGGRPRRRNTRRSRPKANVKVENGKVQSIPIYEGRFGSAFNAARNNGNTIFEWNGRTYNTRLRGESDKDYNDYIASKQLPILLNQLNSSIAAEGDALLNNANTFGYGGPVNLFAGGGNTTNKLNNETYVNGKAVNNIPDSMVLHDDLFNLAIEEYVKTEYDKYQDFVKKGKYVDAYNVANELNNNIVGIQRAYVNAMHNPVKENIKELQTRFNDLGLNKYVNDFLSTKRKVGDKDDYPVYHRRGRKMVKLTSDNSLDYLNGVITQNRFFKFNEDTEKMLRDMELPVTNYSEYAGTLDPNNPEDAPFIPTDAETYLSELPITKMRNITTNHVIKNPDYKEGGNEDEFISIYNDVLKYAPEDVESAEDWWNALSSEQQDEILKAHYKAGDLVRYGVYKNRQLYDVLDDNTSSNEETSNATTESSTDKKDNSDKSYYVPVPRKDWESKAALGVALNDYMNAMFGAGRTFQSPGMDAAYNYLSKVGNIPMVRSHPVGTKLLYVPIDLNYNLNVDRNDMLGALRENNNLNAGNGRNSQFQLINAFNKRIGDTRKQTVEDNLKTLSAILQNNNNVDLLNAQNSLTALSTNAQNIAKAKEALASGASQLASTLAQSYNNWLNYRNAQSSGLAQLLYDMGYNKLILNLRDAAFLLNNQLPDALNTAGVQYVLYNPSLSNNKNK